MQSINIKITGPTGAGKTTVAAIIGAALAKYGFSVVHDEKSIMETVTHDLLKVRKKSIPIHSSINIQSAT